MNLRKKKALAAKTLNVGKEKIIFNIERLAEIKEAITRQDIRDLNASGAILIGELSGRRTKQTRKTRRRYGSIRKKVKKGKRNYIIITRKLRAYAQELRKQEKLPEEQYQKIRKQIKASMFRSKSHLKEVISSGKN